MPAKKKDTEKKPTAAEKAKQAVSKQEMPQTTAEGADRHPDAPDGNAPMVYDARGDGHKVGVEPDHSPEANRPDGSTMPKTVDPLLSPEAQQPGESAEDFAKRQAAQPQPAGSYDAVITREKAPQ